MAEMRECANAVVSFDSEQLVLVDSQDQEIGYASKSDCHDGHGILHRAFSLFVFNHEGELLLQRRSKDKRLWPGYWANTCCSHPRRGETMKQAAQRRLAEEMGMGCDLRYLYKFEYQADYGDLGAERELCRVFVGTSSDPVRVNPNEVDEWRFVAAAALDDEIRTHPERFTPWLKMEWECLRDRYNHDLPLSGG